MYPKKQVLSHAPNQEWRNILTVSIKFPYSDSLLPFYHHVFCEDQAVIVCIVEYSFLGLFAQKTRVIIGTPEM